MQDDSSRWLWFLWGRVICYALSGGLATALMGALSVALAGAITGLLLSWPQFVSSSETVSLGAIFGAILGGGGGGIAGLIIFALIGFFSPPQRRFLPPRPVVTAILSGQVWATAGVGFSIVILELCRGFLTQRTLARCLGDHLIFILFGVPAVMICGAIVSAVKAFRQQKAAPAAD